MGLGGVVKCEEYGAVIVMVLTNIGMGLTNVLIRKALDGGINHMVIATYRLAISALFMSPFALLLERRDRPKLTLTILCQHFISGLLGASLVQYFCLLGLGYTSATVTCAFFSMIPAITFALALLFRTESLNLKNKAGKAKVLGTLVCVGGALLLTFYKGVPISNPHSGTEALHANPHPKKNKTRNWLLGCLFNFIASILLSSWIIFQAKINVAFPCKHSSTVLMSGFASFQCALLSLIKVRDIQGWVLRGQFLIFVVVYSGVVGQAASTVAMTWCIKKKGPVFTSLFYPVMLMSATLFDFLVFRRQLYLSSIIGSIVIVAGLYVYLWGKYKDVGDVPTREETLGQL
ncbi:PREDICTED: WAT1-related protein At1g01070-like [Tarenaya hassleriana]|uniref:WAT1-related protein At1g01070-like n=1 Tax=Tarenaya hassleriana TaxID=28532 RepID=UPI00053C6E88|nr:PREDICTED: WAT1-related protein At1g01070-like [Tarenaya hassleriana]